MNTTTIARHAMRLAALAIVVLAVACAESTGPSTQELAGTYLANANTPGAVFRTTSSGQGAVIAPVGSAQDWLADGAIITLALRSDGTTAGQLFVPAGVGGLNNDFQVDLAGTWTLAGTTVRLAHSADSFLRDMEFTYRDGMLGSQHTFDGTAVEVVLVQR